MVDVKSIRADIEAEFVGRAGDAHYQELRGTLEKLPHGSYVVIAVETGAYVTGPSLSEASSAFERKHGDVLAYVG